MKKGYVVTEIGWEYNDEVYYRGESGGGFPVKIFLDSEEAKKECERLNIEQFKNINPLYYGYGLEEVSDMTEDEINEKLKGIAKLSMENYEFKLNPKATKEQIKKAMNCFNIYFYQVLEVEING